MTFSLLDLLHKLSLTSKASTYDFYRALEKLTNNMGVSIPKLSIANFYEWVCNGSILSF
jgi:hypothetical protein